MTRCGSDEPAEDRRVRAQDAAGAEDHRDLVDDDPVDQPELERFAPSMRGHADSGSRGLGRNGRPMIKVVVYATVPEGSLQGRVRTLSREERREPF